MSDPQHPWTGTIQGLESSVLDCLDPFFMRLSRPSKPAF